MHPAPGTRAVRFVGDSIRFRVESVAGRWPEGHRPLLRTNLGRARMLHEEIIRTWAGRLPRGGASWRDIPMRREEDGWTIELVLAEVGFFYAKAYVLDAAGRQIWPEGPNAGISVHPDRCRTGNTIYCAFTRMFGSTRAAVTTSDAAVETQIAKLDKLSYTVIPPSGKLRDLIRELPHIIDTLGCRILHLLPVNPVPTTGARFGRFGSPYAVQDLTAIDPALVEFDRRTTGVDQFRELTHAVHARGGRVFLDMVINHTGWGSTLHENHPEWFLRDRDGNFASPGAWGVTWEDLVELNHHTPEPWDTLADAFLTWCRRGVDGFRCDAGYKVPMQAWRYIIARVREEYAETIFLLEGLGGSWEATELLLTEGGMQWAYSELFQNYSGPDVARYLDYALPQSHRVGVYVHYSETHDNDRLAAKGRAWSLLRNRLCALTSVSGAFGFTCGVEWLAPEKINVHSSRGLAWGNPDNLIPELSALNRLLLDHPCFFDDAVLTRLSPPESPVLALLRSSAEGSDQVLVLVNTDVAQRHSLELGRKSLDGHGVEPRIDLLGQGAPVCRSGATGGIEFILEAGAAFCLATTSVPVGLAGEAYRAARAAAAFGIAALRHVVPIEEIGTFFWPLLAQAVRASPSRFLSATQRLSAGSKEQSLSFEFLMETGMQEHFPMVVTWRREDTRRILTVPHGHWLLVEDEAHFRASLVARAGRRPEHRESSLIGDRHYAFYPPRDDAGEAELLIESYGSGERNVRGEIRFLPLVPGVVTAFEGPADHMADAMVLLTNGLGGMARLCVDLGRIRSKYDCLLAANLHPAVPVDRHVFVKRLRLWCNANGFISALNIHNLGRFRAGPPAHWEFVASAGDGRTVEVHLEISVPQESNTVHLRLWRPAGARHSGEELPPRAEVRMTARFDIEDRSFHHETKRNSGADHHFATHTRPLENGRGFEFKPAAERRLTIFASKGCYHPHPEWCEHIPHPVEQSRGQVGSGDAFNPGWFDLPLTGGESVELYATADLRMGAVGEIRSVLHPASGSDLFTTPEGDDSFTRQLHAATQAFVVRRDEGKTIIAGYPWFLDWGRDSLICARGLLAAGMHAEVLQLLIVFGRFEQDGTLPNSIHGQDASNRDTSDAPLWYGVVARELASRKGRQIYETRVDSRGRTVADVLRGIAEGYIRGTPNGIRMDPDSALIWSPAHFTWMDTNYPAGTPREGYPIEIQVLWIDLLRQLERLSRRPVGEPWSQLAERAAHSLLQRFWMEERGYLSDVLLASPGTTASDATLDTALRSNGLFAVSFGLLEGRHARRCVDAAARHLVVPGALRTLAPMPVSPPLAIFANHGGGLLNHPSEPYWGRYEGDEDTRRKPAYHNGTAWTWTFPTFCEALARAWEFQPEAVRAARSYLASMDQLMNSGCIGHLPEIVDGDAPHQQRGCDAQAWGVTEALRVWTLLNRGPR